MISFTLFSSEYDITTIGIRVLLKKLVCSKCALNVFEICAQYGWNVISKHIFHENGIFVWNKYVSQRGHVVTPFHVISLIQSYRATVKSEYEYLRIFSSSDWHQFDCSIGTVQIKPTKYLALAILSQKNSSSESSEKKVIF